MLSILQTPLFDFRGSHIQYFGRYLGISEIRGGSKKYEIEESAPEEKIGIRNASFRQVNVGNRDLKKKREEHDHFADSKASTPPFSLFEVRP